MWTVRRLWSFLVGGALELHRQPRPRESPVTHDGLWRHAERFCGLVDAEAAEEPQLDHLRTPCIMRRKHAEGVVECAQVLRALCSRHRQLVHVEPAGRIEPLQGAAAFQGAAGARGINEDSAHNARGHCKEVCPVFPIHCACVYQAQKGVVDQGTRVAADIGPLAADELPSELAQLVVDDGCKLLERPGVASSPGLEQGGDVAGWGERHNEAILRRGANVIRSREPVVVLARPFRFTGKDVCVSQVRES